MSQNYDNWMKIDSRFVITRQGTRAISQGNSFYKINMLYFMSRENRCVTNLVSWNFITLFIVLKIYILFIGLVAVKLQICKYQMIYMFYYPFN